MLRRQPKNIVIYFLSIIILSVLFLSYISLMSNYHSLSPSSKKNLPSQTTCKQISQYGITWTFNKEYPCGRFLEGRGDWWVIGPVTITSVSPVPSNGLHGSMINPKGSNGGHAFDSRDSSYGYDSRLAVQFPSTLQPDTSLLSSISNPLTTNCQIGTSGPKGWLTYDSRRCSLSYAKTVAVLTVLNTVPPTDAFRPSYSSNTKTIYRLSQVRNDLLLNLQPPPNIPSIQTLERQFERPWIDFIGGWYGRHSHPSDNMMDYGYYMTEDLSDAILYLQLNVPNKQILLERFLQYGIDLEGVALSGGYWPADGGHDSGRYVSFVTAGYLLQNPKMQYPLSWMSSPIKENNFGETCQTYFDSQNVARWGLRYWQDPTRADWKDELNAYRTCCTSSAWVGQALTIRLLHLDTTLERQAYLYYVDRWMIENGGTSSQFVKDMWNKYRYDDLVIQQPKIAIP